jgi:ribosome maturation factor RimP
VDIIERIENIITEPLLDKGYSVVRVQLSGNIRRTLQIMIERTDEEAITVDDCAKASHLISVQLDVENAISGSYVLEVSSPGLERPLVKIKDYQRFVGHIVVVKTTQAIRNRKTFQGKLESATETDITITLESPEKDEQPVFSIPYSDIRVARLHVTF